MSAESFIKEVHRHHTKDRGHNVTTRYMEVAEDLGAALKEQERKTSDLFLKMSGDIDEGLCKLDALRATLARLVTAADGMEKAVSERVAAKAEYDSDPAVTCARAGMADRLLAKALCAYASAKQEANL